MFHDVCACVLLYIGSYTVLACMHTASVQGLCCYRVYNANATGSFRLHIVCGRHWHQCIVDANTYGHTEVLIGMFDSLSALASVQQPAVLAQLKHICMRTIGLRLHSIAQYVALLQQSVITI